MREAGSRLSIGNVRIVAIQMGEQSGHFDSGHESVESEHKVLRVVVVLLLEDEPLQDLLDGASLLTMLLMRQKTVVLECDAEQSSESRAVQRDGVKCSAKLCRAV